MMHIITTLISDYWTTLIIVVITATSLPLLSLIYQLYFPTVIKYPWPTTTTSTRDNQNTNDKTTTIHKNKRNRLDDQIHPNDKNTNVILAGSYNPPHRGHLAMIEYLASRYQSVIVVIGMNPSKKYPVSPVQRAQWVERMVESSLPPYLVKRIRVQVVQGYIWKYAMSQNAKILFRGIRTWEKDGVEERSLHKLNLWGPIFIGRKWPLPTFYMEGKPEYCSISSTLIRDICKKNIKKKSASSSSLGCQNDDYGNDNDLSKSALLELSKLVPDDIVRDVALAYR